MREPIVLGYHAVSTGWDAPMAVAPARLEQQIRFLIRLGYHPARFTDAVLRPSHERTFVVTFDDGFRSVLRHGAPILDRLGVPGTLFVPTDWVGSEGHRARWEGMARWERRGHEEELDLLGWDEIRALADRGWEIGSHTCSHPFLTRLADAELAAELTRSRTAVEAELGRPCTSIAYPYGQVDDRVVRFTQHAGYAAGAGFPRLREFTDRRSSVPLRWRRIGVFSVDSTVRFGAKLALTALTGPGAGTTHADAPAMFRGVPPVAPGAESWPRPRVAVVVPCFNDGVLAVEAVSSILEEEAVELVVVDDASTDPATVAALEKLRGRGVAVMGHEVNRGLPAARRSGLAATTAPYVFPLDSDDLLMPGALVRLAERLDADPAAAAAYGDIQEFGTRARRLSYPAALDPFRVAYRNDYPVSSLFRRDALDAVGGWQDVGGMVGYEDWNLWMTFAERRYTAVHAGPGFTAVRRRLHGPRMLTDSARRHRRLYAELRRTHPRLFTTLGQHRRRSTMNLPQRLAYPVLFGGRPPLGLRTTWWALIARARRALRDPG